MPLNVYGGVQGGFSSERIAPNGGTMPTGVFPSGGSFAGVDIPSSVTANTNNLAYARGAMGSDPVYKAATGFLNPNDPTAMWDVAKSGAEHAAGTGMGGSGIAGQYTGRLRQYDIERRAALGNQLLSGAYGRTPPPVNPYAQAQLQLEQANAENRRLLNDIQGRYAPSGGFSQGGGQGGGRSAPMMIGGGGGGGWGGVGRAGTTPPTSYADPASYGSGEIAGGFSGPNWNAINQRSQFYPGEYSPGTMYAGSKAGAPQDLSGLSDEEFKDLVWG